MEERKYCVYVHTNKINGKKYVGVTSLKPEDRWRNGNGYVRNKHFYRAIKKYGWNEGFIHEIIAENLSEENAYQMEIELIAQYNCMNPNGYNATSGGEIGKEYSEEARKKMSNKTKQRMSDLSRRDHLRQKAKEQMANPEMIELLSKLKQGVYDGNKNPMYGKKHTDESKEKISKGRKDKYAGENNPKARKVIRLSDLKIYGYIAEASQDNNINRNTMRKRCKQHKDFMFYDEYLTQQNDLKNNKE